MMKRMDRSRPFKTTCMNNVRGRDDLIALFLTGKMTGIQSLSLNDLSSRGRDSPRKFLFVEATLFKLRYLLWFHQNPKIKIGFLNYNLLADIILLC